MDLKKCVICKVDVAKSEQAICSPCKTKVSQQVNCTLQRDFMNNEGYDTSLFVESLPKIFECSICSGAFREPIHLVDCGHIYCEVCLTRATASQPTPICPNDRVAYTHSIKDKSMKRNVLALKVKCKSEGCIWTGELWDLEDHLKTNCSDIEIKCINDGCLVYLKKKCLPTHARECTFRSAKCHVCHLTKFISFMEVSVDSFVCSDHLLNCTYADLGCIFKGKKATLDKHLKDDVAKHLEKSLTLTRKSLAKINQLEAKNENLQKQLEEKDLNTMRRIDAFQYKLDRLAVQSSLRKPVNESIWCIDNFKRRMEDAKSGVETDIYTPLYYSSNGGYKYQLRADLNGLFNGQNTHVSLTFVLHKGEYDGILEWPFKKKIKVTVPSQGAFASLTQEGVIDDHNCNKKPNTECNTGFTLFPLLVPHENLMSMKYVKYGTMYIKCIVED